MEEISDHARDRLPDDEKAMIPIEINIRQSCEACGKRHSKCQPGLLTPEGRLPCQRCTSLSLPCVYLTPKKPGPKKARRNMKVERVAAVGQQQTTAAVGQHQQRTTRGSSSTTSANTLSDLATPSSSWSNVPSTKRTASTGPTPRSAGASVAGSTLAAAAVTPPVAVGTPALHFLHPAPSYATDSVNGSEVFANAVPVPGVFDAGLALPPPPPPPGFDPSLIAGTFSLSNLANLASQPGTAFTWDDAPYLFPAVVAAGPLFPAHPGPAMMPALPYMDANHTLVNSGENFPFPFPQPPNQLPFPDPGIPRSIGLYDDLYVPEELMTSLIYRFWTDTYGLAPLLVKREIQRHFTKLPEFLPNVFAFGVCYFLSSSGDNSGASNRTALVPVFFERVRRTLMPALELLLGGSAALETPEAVVFPRGSRELVLFVVYALFCLIAVCQAEKSTTSDYLRDADTLLQLAVRVFKTIGSAKEWYFYDQSAFLHQDSFRLTPLIEQCRRIWWGLFSMDRQISILYDRDPLLDLEGCEIGFPTPDAEYDRQMESEEARMQGVPMSRPGAVMGGAVDALGAIDAVVIPKTPPRWFVPPPLPLLGPPGEDATTTAQQPLPPKPRPFHPFEYYVNLMNLFESIRLHRHSASQGISQDLAQANYNKIVSDLDYWFSGLPKPVQVMDNNPSASEYLRAPGSLQILGIAHRLIMFHTAHVLLHSNPNPSLVPSSTWIQSPFFSKALEHALKATAWLNFILQNFRATETPNVATGFFQYCVVHTGLIHLSLLRSQPHPSQSQQESLSRITLHTEALIAGQRGPDWHDAGKQVELTEKGMREGSQGGRRTYWFRYWLSKLYSAE